MLEELEKIKMKTLQGILEMDEFLERNRKKILSGDDREKLHELIKQSHAIGQKIEGYFCPNCENTLVNTYPTGPTCIKSEGGCGFYFK